METDNPFEQVLDRLREKGWTKYRLGDEAGPNCLNGGHMVAACELIDFEEWREMLNPILVAEYRERLSYLNNSYLWIPSFNNHPDTTFADVERVLEKAAVRWEEERVWRDE